MKKVFVDASLIIAALISPTGGSNKLLQDSKNKKLIAITSETVINEVKANLSKIKGVTTDDVNHFIIESKIITRQKVTKKELEIVADILEEKDRHVLAGAILTKCHYLVSLDKKHLLNENIQKTVDIKLVSPKQLIEALEL